MEMAIRLAIVQETKRREVKRLCTTIFRKQVSIEVRKFFRRHTWAG
jgi:hypothetical protein